MKQLPLKIKNIEKKEKKGSHRAWRKEFCQQYLNLVFQTRKNARKSLEDEIITCEEGCTRCCFHYVTVSLAHGIAIADYLYNKKDLLSKFVENYQKWHHVAHSISDEIDLKRIESIISSRPIEEVMAQTRPLSGRYFEMNIRCPFLIEDKCSIYEVRPLTCSGHYSSSSPDWCAPGSPSVPVLHNVIPGDQDLIAMMQLADPRLLVYELTLPKMVNKLLTEGSAAVMAEMTQIG